MACSRLSVSGGLNKRAGKEWGPVGKKDRSGPLLFSPGSSSPLVTLVARFLFLSSSLTESLEQAILKLQPGYILSPLFIFACIVLNSKSYCISFFYFSTQRCVPIPEYHPMENACISSFRREKQLPFNAIQNIT